MTQSNTISEVIAVFYDVVRNVPLYEFQLAKPGVFTPSEINGVRAHHLHLQSARRYRGASFLPDTDPS